MNHAVKERRIHYGHFRQPKLPISVYGFGFSRFTEVAFYQESDEDREMQSSDIKNNIVAIFRFKKLKTLLVLLLIASLGSCKKSSVEFTTFGGKPAKVYEVRIEAQQPGQSVYSPISSITIPQ